MIVLNKSSIALYYDLLKLKVEYFFVCGFILRLSLNRIFLVCLITISCLHAVEAS